MSRHGNKASVYIVSVREGLFVIMFVHVVAIYTGNGLGKCMVTSYPGCPQTNSLQLRLILHVSDNFDRTWSKNTVSEIEPCKQQV